MKIYINKKEVETEDGITLARLLKQQQLTSPAMAAAIGNKVIRKSEWENFLLEDGMAITVISAVCGG